MEYTSTLLEIGCGTGENAEIFAQGNPHWSTIALEKTRGKFEKFERRLREKGKPRNLFPHHTNAVWWISHHLPKESVDRILLLYPNPWPKKRQKNKRWVHMPFMHELLSKLKPKGEIQLATNIETYAKEAENAFTSVWNLDLLEKNTLVKNDLGRARTGFERKYLARGETCYDLVFRKLNAS